MADLKVEIFAIDEIKPHPNADRMELAYIGAWQTCVPIDTYKAGDHVVYLPVDSILSHDVENILFPPGSKVKLKKSRVRSIKLRGAISQGMVARPESLGLDPNIKVGTDVAKKLGIKKYEPPVKTPGIMQGGPKRKRHVNPDFKKYTSIGHFKYYPKSMIGMDVVVTEKIHGTNFRAGYVRYNAYNWWRKALRFLLKPTTILQHEFAYGSHNVELTRKGKRSTGYYKMNVYHMMAEKYRLEEILKPGEVVYGEIYGYGIQKGYPYDTGKDEWKMAVIDVMVNGQYLDFEDAFSFCAERGLVYAPVLYIGPFDYDLIDKEFVNPPGNKSFLFPDNPRPIEGVVVKPVKETNGYMGRMVFKWINDEYWLAKGNTDWH